MEKSGFNKKLTPNLPATNKVRLTQILPLSFGALFLLMVVSGAISKWSANTLVASVGWVTHTYQIKEDLKELEKLLVDAETGQRGFIFTGQEDFLWPYTNASERLDDHFDVLKSLLKDNPEQLKRLREVRNLSSHKMSELAETIVLKRAGKEQQLRALVLSGKGKKIMDDIRGQLAEMTEAENQLLAERQKAASQAEQGINFSSLVVPLAGISLGSAILFLISRKVVSPIDEVVSSLASSSTEIAATVEEQERIATQQAASVNQTTSTMTELGASARATAEQAESSAESARQVLKLAESSAESARQVLKLAEGGTKTVERTLEEMSVLKEKVAALAEQILRLSEQTNQIGSITNIVGDLANQTNMLALNAAVEAVRAGEYGRGFGVVAAEIRKLADQSKRSAEKMNALVGAIQSAINSTVTVTEEGRRTAQEGIKLSRETAEAFRSVTQAIEDVVLSNQETSVQAISDVAVSSQKISLTAQQQAAAIGQVITAMNALNEAAAQTASGISQTKAGIQKLNEAAQSLKDVV
jgi:methyl-accepting chemotaxis protein